MGRAKYTPIELKHKLFGKGRRVDLTGCIAGRQVNWTADSMIFGVFSVELGPLLSSRAFCHWVR
jgi:hypothetical protein